MQRLRKGQFSRVALLGQIQRPAWKRIEPLGDVVQFLSQEDALKKSIVHFWD